MQSIRIISGAFGYKPEGAASVRLITKGQTCEVTDEQAERLVRLGAAELLVEEKVEQPVKKEAEKQEIEKPVKKSFKNKKAYSAAPNLTVEDPV